MNYPLVIPVNTPVALPHPEIEGIYCSMNKRRHIGGRCEACGEAQVWPIRLVGHDEGDICPDVVCHLGRSEPDGWSVKVGRNGVSKYNDASCAAASAKFFFESLLRGGIHAVDAIAVRVLQAQLEGRKDLKVVTSKNTIK